MDINKWVRFLLRMIKRMWKMLIDFLANDWGDSQRPPKKKKAKRKKSGGDDSVVAQEPMFEVLDENEEDGILTIRTNMSQFDAVEWVGPNWHPQGFDQRHGYQDVYFKLGENKEWNTSLPQQRA